jgi:hypothetical protein
MLSDAVSIYFPDPALAGAFVGGTLTAIYESRTVTLRFRAPEIRTA